MSQLRTDKITIKNKIDDSKDELEFVDDDIKEYFGKESTYFIGTPTMMQLVKELRIFNENFKNKMI
jgi:hypothetical protein